MGKVINILLLLAAILFAVVLVVALVLPIAIDPNDFKPEIEAAVKKNTGRDLVIEGDLGLSVFPWLGVETGKISLSNAEGFGERPLAAAQEANVKVKLIPLFSKRVEIGGILLKGLSLNLAIDAHGRNNWSDIGKRTPMANAEKKPVPERKQAEKKEGIEKAEPEGPALSFTSFAAAGISLEDARVSWDNRQADRHVEVKDLYLHTGDLRFGESIDVELSLSLSSGKPKLQETLKLTTRLIVDEGMTKFQFDDLKLDSLSKGKAIRDGELKADLTAQVALDTAKQTLNARDFTLQTVSKDVVMPGAEVIATLTAVIAYDMANHRLQVTDLKLRTEGKGDGLPGGEMGADLAAAIALDTDKQTLKVTGFKLDTEDLSISGELSGEKILDAPVIRGPITVAPFNPRSLMKRLGIAPPETSDDAVLSRLDASFDLEAGEKSAAFENLVLALDDTAAKGRIALADFRNPSIRFNLMIDKLDADRYLPPRQEKKDAAKEPPPPPKGPASAAAISEAPAAAAAISQAPAPVTSAAATAAADDELFSVEALRRLNLNGTLAIGEFKGGGLKMENVQLKLDAENGLIQTDHSVERFYQGDYKGALTLDARNRPPVLSLNERLGGVQMEPLLRDLQGKAKITGTADIGANLTGRGEKLNALKASLSGKVDTRMQDGVIRGFNLQKIVDQAEHTVKRFKGEETELQTSEKDQTEYSEISATATVTNGVVRNEDLLVRSPLMRLDGKGKVNLLSEEIDYKVIAKLIKSAATETEAEKIKALPLAIQIGGDLSKPRYRLSLEDMVKEKEKAKIEEKKQELMEKLEKKLPGAGDLLKKMF